MERTGLERRSEEVEKMKDKGVDKESKRTEGKGRRRGESGKAHNATSKSGVDESGLGKGRYP